MPSEKQRRACLDEQLAEAPLLHERRHAVKDERRAEQVHHALAENPVGVIDRVESGKRERGGGEANPSAARDSGDCERRERRRAAKHEHGENARRERLGGEVVPERQNRQFHQNVAADGKASVNRILESAVFVQADAGRQAEVVFGRQILGNRQRPRRSVVVRAESAVEMRPVAAERQQRDEHEQRKRSERQPIAPFGDARASERE